jgi:apolipoprotein N-acyltransferase
MAIAAGLGAAGALAFEPFRLFSLLLISYAAMVLLLDGAASGTRRYRDAALIGWSFGFGFFLVGLYWIGYAFLVDAATHGWQMPFAMILLPAGLGLFYAAAGAAAMLRWRRGLSRIFVFTLAFFIAEWLRGHILTGFPWNLPAYGWGASTALLQSASVLGAYGLSLLTILFGAALASLPTGETRGRFLAGGLALAFVALWGSGELRLMRADDATVPGVHLRIVQPATPQSEKYVAANLVRNWRRLTDLSASPANVPPTHIIWPEAAPPFALSREPQAQAEIATLLGDDRVLLTGDVRIAMQAGAPTRFYNSFAIYGPHGKLLGMSDKFHLVPFGEYLPFERALRAIGISEIAADTGFSSGSGPETFSLPGAPPVGPLICYEVIFPGEVTGVPRPLWLVNLTDDSWFGPDTGPMQHLLIARVRAIEEGLPIVRAANSGISAVIDSYGRVRASLALGLRGVIDNDLPVALSETIYARYGDMILLLLLLICAGAAVWPVRSYET